LKGERVSNDKNDCQFQIENDPMEESVEQTPETERQTSSADSPQDQANRCVQREKQSVDRLHFSGQTHKQQEQPGWRCVGSRLS
jgi:hypothetical protein